MGGHVVLCNACGVQEYAYHSCRHRSCPKCGQQQGEDWLDARRKELLPVPYFHVVFTVPKELRRIIRKHQRVLYRALITAAARTLLEVARNPRHAGGNIGVMAVLHTWTRTLEFHPHVHCLVPAGVIDEHGQWRGIDRPWLAPHKLLAKVFRAKLLALMSAEVPGLHPPGSVFRTPWVVHVDLPKHGSDRVLQYLARYVHRTALSDHRILKVTATHVLFKYRDRERRHWHTMKLSGQEFLRRFLQHVWPKGFHKVRYFGFWSRASQEQLQAVRNQLLGQQAQSPTTGPTATLDTSQTANQLPAWRICPHCKTGHRIILARFNAGSPQPPLRPYPAMPPPTPPPP